MSKSNVAVNTAVQVTSDTSTLLRALSKTFSRGTIFVSELIQNARRAGATLIRVTITEDEFTVIDDGVGIDDFSVLLALAKSGWEDEVQRVDRPYGLGWVASLFNSTEVEVISCGQRLAATTEHLLAIKPVALEPAPLTKGTTMTLRGHGRKVAMLESAVIDLSKGYPVPIELNGQLLQRPFALDANLDWVDVGIGQVNRQFLLTGGYITVYLQGARISTLPERGRGWQTDNALHLDSTQFEGRLPDRDQLIDAAEAEKRITETLRQAAIQEIVSRAAGMSPEDFIGTFGERLAVLDAWDVLAAYDCVPVRWVEIPDLQHGTLALNVDTDSCWKYPEGAVVSREQLQARGLYFALDDGEDVRAEAWALFKGGFRIDRETMGPAPDSHWINGLVQTIDSENISEVRMEEPFEKTVSIEGSWVEADLKVAKRLFLVHDTLGEVEVPSGEGVFLVADGTVYATPETASAVVLQANSFIDSNDHYDEEREEEAKQAFDIALASIVSPNPAATLKAFLDKGLPWRAPEDLRGRSFTVAFDSAGQSTVTLAS